jgi:hypothetical protein
VEKIVRRAAVAVLLAGGLLTTDGAALAAEPPTTASGDGVLAGNAVSLDLDAPITLCGLIGVLVGAPAGGCVTLGDPIPDTTQAAASGDGVVTGNAIAVDVDLPVTVAGSSAPPPSPCCAPPPSPCCTPATVPCCVPPTTVPCCVPPTTVPPTTVPPTTAPPTTVPSTTVPPPGPPSSPGPDTATSSSARLPVTGGGTGVLVPVGAGALAAGAFFLAAARRTRRSNGNAPL